MPYLYLQNKLGGGVHESYHFLKSIKTVRVYVV